MNNPWQFPPLVRARTSLLSDRNPLAILIKVGDCLVILALVVAMSLFSAYALSLWWNMVVYPFLPGAMKTNLIGAFLVRGVVRMSVKEAKSTTKGLARVLDRVGFWLCALPLAYIVGWVLPHFLLVVNH